MSDDAITSVERLALDLLAIPSVIGDERAIADHVETRLRELGPATLRRQGDNLFARARADRDGRPRLLLLGHLDTVPGSEPNPPRVDGDRLCGLGASDMKSGLALMLDALAFAIRGGSPFDVGVGFYAAEEGPYERSGLPDLRATAGPWFDGVALAVCLEPTDNAIELGCLGTLHATVRFLGRRAHSARPWEGRNALHMAAPLLTRLGALAPRDVTIEGLSFREVAVATMIRIDGARNVVPGACEVNVNLRFAPDRDEAGARRFVEELVTASSEPGWKAEDLVRVEVTDLAPSGRVCRTNPHVVRLEGVLGAGAIVRSKQAWTDVGRLSSWGLDAINFGPGSGTQAHQVGEFASRARLAEGRAVLRAWLG